MTTRIVKTALVILLGFLLTWQSVPTAYAGHGPIPSRTQRMMCCRSGCSNCNMPCCCAKSPPPSSPLTPCPASSKSQNEWHLLAVAIVTALILPVRQVDQAPSFSAPSVTIPTVPLFQRDCSYLI